MNRRRYERWAAICLVTAAAVLVGVVQARASGFYTPDIGAKTVGRGAAWIVGNDDLTAIYLNPAGLAHMRGTNLMVVNNYDIFHTAYDRSPIEPAVHNENPVDIIQFMGLGSDFGLKNFTFAVGLYGPYGVNETYDESGPQRYTAISIEREQVYYMVGAGWGPWDWLRVGAAFGLGEFAEDDLYALSPLNDMEPQNDVIAHAEINQFGLPMYAFGLQVGPFNGFEFGGSYQPMTDVRLKGEIQAYLPDMYASVIGDKIYHDKMTVDLQFPQIIRAGVRQRITRRLDVEFDVVWIGWARFKEQKIDFEKADIMDDFVVETGWRDTWDFRFGGDYEIFHKLFLRAGTWYDQSATPQHNVEAGSVEMPRWAANCGFGYTWKGLTFDFAYSHIWMREAEVETEPDPDVLEIGDARGRYAGSYDMLVFGMNLNFNEMADALGR